MASGSGSSRRFKKALLLPIAERARCTSSAAFDEEIGMTRRKIGSEGVGDNYRRDSCARCVGVVTKTLW